HTHTRTHPHRHMQLPASWEPRGFQHGPASLVRPTSVSSVVGRWTSWPPSASSRGHAQLRWLPCAALAWRCQAGPRTRARPLVGKTVEIPEVDVDWKRLVLDLCNELMSFVPVCGPLWDAVKASQRRDTVGYVLNFCLAVLDVVSLGISVEVKA
ncbi:unnamed protein product, partial [Effrenium voratum]